MENLFENINKIELISYFSSEIFCILGVFINIAMFIFFSKKNNIKRASDITTFVIFAICSMMTLGLYFRNKFVFGDVDFSILNNAIVFSNQVLLLKFAIYLFLTLFVLTMYKTARKARFKMTISNSCLLLLAVVSVLLIQVENKILAFFLLDVCSFFIYKYASNMRIRKPDAYCSDFILLSATASVLFYSFWGLTFFIVQELQLAIIEVCMICALLLKAGIFPIYNYSITRKVKNNLAYSVLLFDFLPFLGLVVFCKFIQTIMFSNNIYLMVVTSFLAFAMVVSSICAFQTKNLIRYIANMLNVYFSFYMISILFLQNSDLYINKMLCIIFAAFAVQVLLAILKINFKEVKLNIALLNGLFIKNRLFSCLFSFGLLLLVNVVPSLVLINNFKTLNEVYCFDEIGFWVVFIFSFSNVLVLLNLMRIIKAIYTKKEIKVLEITKRTTLNYVVPFAIFLILIIGMFL